MTKLWISGTAKFSEDKNHRYLLTRQFQTGVGTTLFIGLNPSTATEEVDDPTIRRCIGFSLKWGHQRLEMANAFALRSTDPKKLYKHPDPVGPENDRYILEAATRANIVVLAWGHHAGLRSRDNEILTLLKNVKVYCLGVTKDGYPKHPLYVAATTQLVPYSKRAIA